MRASERGSIIYGSACLACSGELFVICLEVRTTHYDMLKNYLLILDKLPYMVIDIAYSGVCVLPRGRLLDHSTDAILASLNFRHQQNNPPPGRHLRSQRRQHL